MFVRVSPRQMRALYQQVLRLAGQYEIILTIPPPVSSSRSRYLRPDTGARTLNTARITYRSPPISSGISLMLFHLLLRRVTIPGTKVVIRRTGSAKEGLRLDRSRLYNELLLLLCSPPSK